MVAKSLFADEPVEYWGRALVCGWSARPQSAAEIAASVQQFARSLGDIDPAYGQIRPDPGMRKFRPGDLGPVVDMTLEELGDRIDRRGRFDPPRFPAPVSAKGYNVLYRNDLMGMDPSFLALGVRVGQYGPTWVDNRVDIHIDNENPIWRDPEEGIRVLDAMVSTWRPEWACASCSIKVRETGNNIPSERRPWLVWTEQLRPAGQNSPDRPAYPHPFPFDEAGPPAEVRSWRGGELSIWP